jgi:uncharacterized protein (TIGR03067 family)
MNSCQGLILTLVLGAPALKDRAQDSPIVGTWAIESFSAGGEVKALPITWEWEFTDDGNWLVRTGGRDNVGARTFVVNAKAKPATIDLISEVGAEPSAGIFRIDGDTLTMCLSPAKGAATNEL